MNQINRARSYLAKLPSAISGQLGHNATLTAACRLREFGLNWTEAWRLLVEWNETHCEPPWTERELHHKLKDAFRRTRPQERFVSRVPAGGDIVARGPTMLQAHTRPKTPATLRPPASKLTLGAGTPRQIAALASLRGLSPESVALASIQGVLRFGEYRGAAAWFILDRSNRIVQARRMDGCDWLSPASHKALNLPGSDPRYPVGIQEASGFQSIALCEGGADMLAAFHFLFQQSRLAACAPVAMLGAACPVHADALPLFAGKRVRIFQHSDDAGSRAAKRWASQLAPFVASVEIFSFEGLYQASGQPVKDLNDLVLMPPSDFAHHLSGLFP